MENWADSVAAVIHCGGGGGRSGHVSCRSPTKRDARGAAASFEPVSVRSRSFGGWTAGSSSVAADPGHYGRPRREDVARRFNASARHPTGPIRGSRIE